MKQIKMQSDELLTSEQVKHYLLQHPDFFAHQLDLLEQLSIPHPCGNAVSLVSKQLELLRKKNRQLRHQLDQLILIARENDKMLQKMHLFILEVLRATRLEEMLAVVETRVQDCFAVEYSTLRIINGSDTADHRPATTDDAQPSASWSTLLQGSPLYGDESQPELVAYLFGDQAPEIASYAIIPLRSTTLLGLFAIASRDKERFHPRMGDLFLRQLGELLGLHLASLLQQPDSHDARSSRTTS